MQNLGFRFQKAAPGCDTKKEKLKFSSSLARVLRPYPRERQQNNNNNNRRRRRRYIYIYREREREGFLFE